MTNNKKPKQLRGLNLAELTELCVALDQKPFRGKQLFEWIYTHRIQNVHEITNMPASFLEKLSHIPLSTLTLGDVQESEDGTKKILFTTAGGKDIETVIIPSELVGDDNVPKRRTICVSTQIGCALDCAFCATGSMGLLGNLSAGEIMDQFIIGEQVAGTKLTNLVYMGMGEPMMNYNSVMRSVELLTDSQSNMLGAKRITLSTAGVVKNIRRMADEDRKIKLAVSLHSVHNHKRSDIMPINNSVPIEQLMETVEYYYRKTRIPVTYEYIVFGTYNTSRSDVQRLARITRRVPSKVNVIPFHDVDFVRESGGSVELTSATQEQFDAFVYALKREGVTVMARSSSGKDIHAACGQLALSKG